MLKLDPDSPVEGVNEINTSMPPVEEAGVEEDSKMIVEEEEEEEQEGVEDLIDAVDQWSLADDKMLKNVNVVIILRRAVGVYSSVFCFS